METEMVVKGHKTIEKQDYEPVYSVVFKPDIKIGKTQWDKVTLSSESDQVFQEYPLGDRVVLRIVKPQQKLEESTRRKQ